MSRHQQTPHPIHPRHLQGSAWTRAGDDLEHRHWEVITWRKSAGEVVLRAVLDAKVRVTIPWRQLRDRERWQPGHQRLPLEPRAPGEPSS